MDAIHRSVSLAAMAGTPSLYQESSPASNNSSGGSNSSGSGNNKKQQRQTRINEHLKATKKASSKVGISAAAGGKRARASSPKKSSSPNNKTKLEAVIAAQKSSQSSSAAASLAFPANENSSVKPIDAMASLGSPMKERPAVSAGSSSKPRKVASNRASHSATTVSHPSTVFVEPQHVYAATASPERMQYSLPSQQYDGQFGNEMMMVETTPQQIGYPYYPTPQTTSNALDNAMARTTARPSMNRRYTSNSRGAKTVASSSSSSSLTNTRKSSISSRHSASMMNAPFSPISPDLLPPPLKRRNTNSTTTSVSSGVMGGSEGGSAPSRSITSLSMTAYPSSSNMSNAFSMSGFSLSGMSTSNNSPKTPGSIASSGMMLAISTDGKACITPRSELAGFNFSVPSPPSLAPLMLGSSAGMSKSASQALASSLPILSPPHMMMRSNTLDLRPTQSSYPSSLGIPGSIPLHQTSSSLGFSLPSDFLTSNQQGPPLQDARAGDSLAAQVQHQQPPPTLYQSSRQRADSIQSTASMPLLQQPEKQGLQSGWKFPLVGGLNLSTSAAPGNDNNGSNSSSESSSSRPGTALTSSFPSMNSLNRSIVAVDKEKGGPNHLETELGAAFSTLGSQKDKRQACIQAWLDSPELDEEASAGEAWSTLPSREWTDNETYTTSTSSSASLNLAIRPEDLTMQRSKSDMPKNLSLVYDDEEEELDGVRVSGKSVKPLRVTRKRRMEDDKVGENNTAATGENVAVPAAEKAGLGSPIRASRQVTPVSISKSSPKKGTKAGKVVEQSASSPNKKVGSNASVLASVATEAKNRKGRKNGKKGTKGGRSKGAIGCGCGAGDDGEPMVQCDTCATWYHLSGLDLDDEELGEEWFCSVCSAASASSRQEAESPTTGGAVNMTGEDSYPSPASPVRHPIDLSSQEAPTTPPYPTSLHEPTFSHHTTPKYNYSRRFEDAHLVPAPTIRRTTTPSTPLQNGGSFVPGHNVTHSLSRQYAPVTPRVGYGSGTAFTPAQSGRRNPGAGQDMWGNYLPSTPSNGFVAHGRRLSRHFRAPSNTFIWEDLAAPSARMAAGPKDEDAERARQWGLFYSDGISGVHQHSHHQHQHHSAPTTPPMSQSAGFAPASSGEDAFLPHDFDPEEAARQRFLELNSTPSRWGDPQRFPSMAWDD